MPVAIEIRCSEVSRLAYSHTRNSCSIGSVAQIGVNHQRSVRDRRGYGQVDVSVIVEVGSADEQGRAVHIDDLTCLQRFSALAEKDIDFTCIVVDGGHVGAGTVSVEVSDEELLEIACRVKAKAGEGPVATVSRTASPEAPPL